MTEEKKDNATRFKEELEKKGYAEAKVIAMFEGVFNELEINIKITVFDKQIKNENQHLAALEVSKKGKTIMVVEGALFGMLNGGVPTLFRIKAGASNGAVDILKMYKVGNSFEGKFYPLQSSISKKRASLGATPYEVKKRVDDVRDSQGVAFTMRVDPKLTVVSIPDNKKVEKPSVNSTSNLKPG